MFDIKTDIAAPLLFKYDSFSFINKISKISYTIPKPTQNTNKPCKQAFKTFIPIFIIKIG